MNKVVLIRSCAQSWSRCERDCTACKAKHIYYSALQRKSLPSPDLERGLWSQTELGLKPD